MKKMIMLITVIGIFVPGIVRAETGYTELYVDPTYSGSDSNVFNNLTKANAEAKKLLSSTPVRINIKAGNYTLKESFTPADGANQVVYRCTDGKAKFIGAAKVNKKYISAADETIEPRLNASSVGNIKRIDLKAAGLTNYGTVPERGYVDSSDSVFEMKVFSGDTSYRNARWPNTGFAVCGYVSDYDAKDSTGTLQMECLEGRQLNWKNEKNGFIEAFNNYEYRSASSPIKHIDEETGYMILGVPGDTISKFDRTKRYYAYNILEELDSPGEFYLDRENGYLYFYQEADVTADVYVANVQNAVVNISGGSDISFENIDICNSGSNGVKVSNSKNISFTGCDVSDINGTGVIINESSDVSFIGGEISDCGSHGIDIKVTIPDDIKKSNITISGNTITRCADKNATSVAAIKMDGTGITVSDNEIYDMPHQAIQFSGLKNLISNNEIYDVCKNVRDAGAIYIGRSWSWRGNRITGNYIHDITGYYGYDITCIYLDDYMSGVQIDNNILADCPTAIGISGGRENIVTDNFIYNCEESISCVTHWGIDNDEWYSKDGTNASKNLYYKLKNVTYLEKLLEEYPEVEYIYNTDDHPEYPKNNIIENNTLYNSGDVNYDENVKTYGSISTKGVKYTALYK